MAVSAFNPPSIISSTIRIPHGIICGEGRGNSTLSGRRYLSLRTMALSCTADRSMCCARMSCIGRISNRFIPQAASCKTPTCDVDVAKHFQPCRANQLGDHLIRPDWEHESNLHRKLQLAGKYRLSHHLSALEERELRVSIPGTRLAVHERET